MTLASFALVAFKLSRRKNGDMFKLLHTILFWRIGKVCLTSFIICVFWYSCYAIDFYFSFWLFDFLILFNKTLNLLKDQINLKYTNLLMSLLISLGSGCRGSKIIVSGMQNMNCGYILMVNWKYFHITN